MNLFAFWSLSIIGVITSTSVLAAAPNAPMSAPIDARQVHWLDTPPASTSFPGATWGTPWPQGKIPASTTFALRSADGTTLPMQTWPLAYWPDGSLKWTGHAIPASVSTSTGLS